jgi:hypothetical protein
MLTAGGIMFWIGIGIGTLIGIVILGTCSANQYGKGYLDGYRDAKMEDK